jgi:hypothetical protein
MSTTGEEKASTVVGEEKASTVVGEEKASTVVGEEKASTVVGEEKASDRLLPEIVTKISGKNLVFVHTDVQLNSALAFAQYIFRNKRLITFISEFHERSWVCPEPSITIAEYCKNAVQRNSKCKIMLEYNPGEFAIGMGSEAIRDTYKTLYGINRLDSIIPFDFRSYFIGTERKNQLYGGKFPVSKVTIQNGFINSFEDKLREDPTLFRLSSNYDSDILDYMYNKYYKNIEKQFGNIKASLNAFSRRNLRKLLMDAWRDVADYYILREIFRNDEIDEYIVVMGDAHYVNMTSVLETEEIGATLINKQKSNQTDCIKLYTTLRFD